MEGWKSGFFVFDVETYNDFCDTMDRVRGTIDIFIDITDEFDEFQNVLKKDWFNRQKEDKQTPKQRWNNRKHFMPYVLQSKDQKSIFYLHSVHLDDTSQIARLFTHVKPNELYK